MKCPVCHGRTVEQILIDGLVDVIPCKCCDGKGVVEPLTEQEYIQSCNTEQLISFLLWYPNNVHGYPKPKMSIAEEEDAIREWLKQPHNSSK